MPSLHNAHTTPLPPPSHPLPSPPPLTSTPLSYSPLPSHPLSSPPLPPGEVIEEDIDPDSSKLEESLECTEYSLRGIVVHSGQASGGHYYSFIRYR